MSRLRRKTSTTDIYHVVAHGAGKQILFEDDECRRRFLEILMRYKSTFDLQVYAWCLMGNHVHLLLCADKDSLSRAMQGILLSYARFFNEKTGHAGHVFQGRFMSEPIEDEAYLLAVLCYIHRNPEEAGICDSVKYEWSSYHEYIGSALFADTERILSIVGGVDAFKRLCITPAKLNCLDTGTRRRQSLRDEEASSLAKEALDMHSLMSLKALPKEERNNALEKLKPLGISIRQAARLTGVGENIVARIYRR